MTELTDSEVRALLDDLRKPWTIAENMQPLLPLAADAIEALLQARADAAVAVALVVERAAKTAMDTLQVMKTCSIGSAQVKVSDAIRALADTDALAELARLRDELLLMKTAGIIEVMVRNPSVADYVQHWEGRTLKAEAERDTLAAALATQAEQLASLVPVLTEVSAACHQTARDRDLSEWELAFMRKVDAALDAATLATMTPQERALCERSLAVRAGWKKVAEGQG